MLNQIDYKQLAAEMFTQAATKAASSTPSGNWGHGDGGLFAAPGLDRLMFSTMMWPHLGLQRVLPTFRSRETNPLFGIMTGMSDVTGDNPTNPCDDFPQAGMVKLCMHTAVFGRIGLESQVIQVDRAGELTNRGEFVDFGLVGQPVQNGAGIPTFGGQSLAGALNNEGVKKTFEMAASWAQKYGRLLYQGTPSNNTSGDGYKEYYGLETLVNTGYRDAETNDLCPAADSIVWAFGNTNITSTSPSIVEVLQDIFFRLRHLASRAGLGNVTWRIAMPLGMFYRLTEVWAYYYITSAINGLTFDSSVNVNLGGDAVTGLRDAMRGNLQTRQGQFLMIDGNRVDVIIDDAIPETEVTPGVFSSDIYILPFTVLGGTPVLFMDYFNYDGPNGAIENARQFAPADSYYTTDQGIYLWHKKPPTNWCVEMAATAKPRLILRTPYVAARITDVAWTPVTQHERQAFTDQDYYASGGRTDRLGWGPSFFPPISS